MIFNFTLRSNGVGLYLVCLPPIRPPFHYGLHNLD